MKNLVIPVFAVLLLSVWTSNADEGHDHGDNTHRPSESGMTGPTHEHNANDAHHQHEEWIDPPKAYAGKVSDKWADADAIARGEGIYQAKCMVCHGADGQGTGAMAQALSHPPADLTNNFHASPGNGDAYLFWRVSEGGTVEPFKSQDSAMPAFKQVLSVSERWAVLAYVHTFFHQGLKEWSDSDVADEESQPDGTDS